MRIFNVRLGLATNSSSTHSLVLLPEQYRDDKDTESGEFGWGLFTAASREAKRKYLAITLRDNVLHLLDRGHEYEKVPEPDRQAIWAREGRDALAVVRDWMGPVPGVTDASQDDNPHVDHQSEWTLPRAWDGKQVDREFFQGLAEWFLRDGVVVLGGNDNGGGDHPLKSFGPRLYLPLGTDDMCQDVVARHDPQGDYWVTFNRATGKKVRFTFRDVPSFVTPTKASGPELVDVKITDFCPTQGRACAQWCYQGSTQKGQHAALEKIERIVRALADLKVMEIAYGGGEVIEHPDFVAILKMTRDLGVVPNFTTKSLGWLRDEKRRAAILGFAGGFAYSIQGAHDVAEFKAALDPHDLRPTAAHASIQLVLGTVERDEFKRILHAIADQGVRATLLGYKTVGRGSRYTPVDYSWWLDVVRQVVQERAVLGDSRLQVGVDTVVAQQYEREMLNAGIPSWCFTTQEGKFSMYIDAVAMQAGPSSYCEPEFYRPLGENPDCTRVKQVFAEF